MITQVEQRKAAKNFAETWEGIGYEKGDSARFWISLLQNVYGVENPTDFIRFEDRVMLDHTSFIDGYIPATHVLIEQKSIDKDLGKAIRQSDGSLLTPFQQAKRYSAELPYSDRPRWIVISNFKKFHIYDMENPSGEPEVLYLKDLEKEFYRMSFLVHQEDKNIEKMKNVSLQAGELVGKLYDALLNEYQNPEDEKTLEDLNTLSVRLVFCFYAEDSGLFGRPRMFHDYLKKHKGIHFRTALIRLFRVLNQKPEERDPYLEDNLAAFPFVNGGLFEKRELEIPRLNDEIIDIILNQASSSFDWSNISPTIFGGVFESTLNPETRRSGGMHYTSIKNIHKVIDPLFMDDLNAEFEKIQLLKTHAIRERRLEEFQTKLASLKFLDPAVGSGNFLTETYISLRRLENEVIKNLYGDQVMLGLEDIVNPIKVSITQFYGIEINDFAATVARTALWIAESQMMQETEDIMHTNIDFLPIESEAKIIEGNALKIDWEKIVLDGEIDYIMGNPPFIGGNYQTDEQRQDMREIFGEKAKLRNLDYVASWFLKTAQLMNKRPSIKAALISTNSITQGEQVETLWQPLLENGITINFAHTTFKWTTESQGQAGVYVVIIGFSKKESSNDTKWIYTSDTKSVIAENINPYLVDAPNIIVKESRTPLSGQKKMGRGNQPTEGGNLLLSKQEKEELLDKDPGVKKWIKKIMGAREFIHGNERYCLWFADADMREVRKHSFLMDRIEKVKEMRLASKDAGTRKRAETPWLFRESNNPDTALVIPSATSDNRKYIPIGYIDKSIILTNLVHTVADGSLLDFSIVTSNVHMAWMRTVAGRLGTGYRYSSFIVYNTFPWPDINDDEKAMLENKASNILKARELYPDWSLADLYDELTMPPELRKAHQKNDRAVMEVYGFDWRSMTESECVAQLMKMYEKLTASK